MEFFLGPAYCFWWHITIGIGGVEKLVVDKILRRYIETSGVEPLVVDILRFCGVKSDFLWGKCWKFRQLQPETGESMAIFLKSLTTI